MIVKITVIQKQTATTPKRIDNEFPSHTRLCCTWLDSSEFVMYHGGDLVSIRICVQYVLVGHGPNKDIIVYYNVKRMKEKTVCMIPLLCI